MCFRSTFHSSVFVLIFTRVFLFLLFTRVLWFFASHSSVFFLLFTRLFFFFSRVLLLLIARVFLFFLKLREFLFFFHECFRFLLFTRVFLFCLKLRVFLFWNYITEALVGLRQRMSYSKSCFLSGDGETFIAKHSAPRVRQKNPAVHLRGEDSGRL